MSYDQKQQSHKMEDFLRSCLSGNHLHTKKWAPLSLSHSNNLSLSLSFWQFMIPNHLCEGRFWFQFMTPHYQLTICWWVLKASPLKSTFWTPTQLQTKKARNIERRTDPFADAMFDQVLKPNLQWGIIYK